ncbi:MAG: hypothetical protein ACI4OJ_06610 [Lachnospiraceae bacterium]
MKKRMVQIILAALAAGTLAVAVPTALPGSHAEAASVKLAGGTTVDAVPVAGTVADGSTGTLLVLDTQAGQFNIVLDTDTQYGSTEYLNKGAIILTDIYAGSDNKFHAADIQVNTDNTKKTGSVEVGTSVAKAASASSSGTTVKVQEKTTRVSGVVDSATTTDLLVLKTSDGVMKITLDTTTDMSDGKVLIPGGTYKVDIYRGDGDYNHAAKIIDTSDNTVGTNAGVNTSKTITYTGTVLAGTKQNKLLLKASDGSSLTIKIDSGTDTSACHVLKEGQKITATVAFASDAYLHAVSLVDNTEKVVTVKEGSMGDTGMLTGQSTVTVQGTVQSDSTDDVMLLSVNGQTMKLRLDSGSKGTNLSAIVPGFSYSVSLYLGTDGYNHVATITNLAGNDAGTGSNVNKNTTTSVTGTITDARCGYVKLKDSQGSVWTIRLDTTTDVSKCRILRTGRKIKASCALGTDGYWHATALART